MLFYNTAAVFFEILLNFIKFCVVFVCNFGIYRRAVVVFARVIGQNVQPILTVFVKECGVIVLNTVKVFEGDE